LFIELDVTGEATNELNGKQIVAVTYGKGSLKYQIPQNVNYSFKKPQIVEVLTPQTDFKGGPIETTDELPTVELYYNGENNLNIKKINCKIYANQNECFHQSYCGWCGTSKTCISGNNKGPLEACGTVEADLATYLFNAPISSIHINNLH
jgi:hypothetical protein